MVVLSHALHEALNKHPRGALYHVEKKIRRFCEQLNKAHFWQHVSKKAAVIDFYLQLAKMALKHDLLAMSNHAVKTLLAIPD